MSRRGALWLVFLPFLHAQTPLATLIDHGHYKRARDLAEQRYREAPEDPDVLWALSRVKQEFGDLNAAVILAEELVAREPKKPRSHARLADALGEKAGKSGVFEQMRLALRFKKELNLALSLDPLDPDALSLQLIFYREAPGLFGGDKKKAREVAEQITKVDPAKGYLAQSSLLTDRQEGEREVLLRKAAVATPLRYEALIALGGFLLRSNRSAEAEAQARAARTLAPDREAAHAQLAIEMVQGKRWTELDAVLAEAEKDNPENLAAYFFAANQCVKDSVELPRAERYVRKYLAMDPEPNELNLSAAQKLLAQILNKQSK